MNTQNVAAAKELPEVLSTGEFDFYEDVLLSELRKRLPLKPSYFTLRRWAVDGIRSRSGKVGCRLAVVQLPGGIASSLYRYSQFLERLQE